MKIGLIGYGKMGKAVESLSLKKGFSCALNAMSDVDVCIDFSTARAVKQTALSIHVPWVLGTTGWDKDEILPIVRERQIPFLYAPNFSTGVALFRKLVKHATQAFEGFEMQGIETHHTQKIDAPSGTALKLMSENEGLLFTSIRKENEVGTHQIFFRSEEEELELTHRAFDRKVFARGALNCASWLIGKSGVYTFDDYISERYACQFQA